MDGPGKADRGRDNEEETWRDLVARLGEPQERPGVAGHGGQAAPWPADEDADSWLASTRVVRPAQPPDPGQAPPDEPDETDDHYIPPPPPPLPRLDPIAKGAWLALFGGPAYLLVTTVAGWAVPAWAAFCAVAAFIGGFMTLVLRMSDDTRGDSGPDDGAVG